MQTQSFAPQHFNSFFEAETHLEKHGYQCQQSIWCDNKNHFATVVASREGVSIQFINTGEMHS